MGELFPAAIRTMPAISLWQPWASFIAIGVKPYETRHWRAPSRMIGTRIVIHAAKHPVTADDREWWHHICGVDKPLPLGAMVCSALLRAVVLSESVPADDFGDYAPGRFCWHLTEVRRFVEPIPAKGQQGFWTWQVPDGLNA